MKKEDHPRLKAEAVDLHRANQNARWLYSDGGREGGRGVDMLHSELILFEDVCSMMFPRQCSSKKECSVNITWKKLPSFFPLSLSILMTLNQCLYIMKIPIFFFFLVFEVRLCYLCMSWSSYCFI